MASFSLGNLPTRATATEAEKAQQRNLKELERLAKAQRKNAAKEHKAAKRQEQKAQKEAKQAHQAVQKSHRQAVKQAKKATKSRIRMARKAEKDRMRLRRRQVQRARQEVVAIAAGGVLAPPFSKSAGCYVCGKKFGQALHRRRHHCRQCRESCCLQCTSNTRRPVPLYGLKKPQKVCVVCNALVLNNESTATSSQPREPAEAVAALAASGRAARRPHSAPLPPTTGVTVATRGRQRGRTRSTKSKGGSIWTLPIRPLLKKKKSAEQLRNRKLDMDLQMEKRALFGSRGVELQPQAIAPPAP
ncbi:FYVE zinc finger domain-containing protein [Phytophthora infestans]|uniref:FYVE zinc finger domain-containing protein n=1 Tax=Phytophthora infestans TaxID=4787 RepID=A0A833W8M8_PHYIN|nr:FYVE zinc finger domain-containing protein [Phytophthora infestans]